MHPRGCCLLGEELYRQSIMRGLDKASDPAARRPSGKQDRHAQSHECQGGQETEEGGNQ